MVGSRSKPARISPCGLTGRFPGTFWFVNGRLGVACESRLKFRAIWVWKSKASSGHAALSFTWFRSENCKIPPTFSLMSSLMRLVRRDPAKSRAVDYRGTLVTHLRTFQVGRQWTIFVHVISR